MVTTSTTAAARSVRGDKWMRGDRAPGSSGAGVTAVRATGLGCATMDDLTHDEVIGNCAGERGAGVWRALLIVLVAAAVPCRWIARRG
jgi:hypothetical protein